MNGAQLFLVVSRETFTWHTPPWLVWAAGIGAVVFLILGAVSAIADHRARRSRRES